jgi:hypothetical protein
MENPRTIHRLPAALLVTFAAAAVAGSIYFETPLVLLAFLGIAIGFHLVCISLAFLNILIFGPIFWLIAKLDSRMTHRPDQAPADSKNS